MSTMTGIRQERAAATRKRILSAAHDLFVSRGYRATSLRDIAAAAGISHPGLLGHFATKDALLAEVVAELEDANIAVLNEIVAAAEPGSLALGEVAARNAGTEGYLELFAALTGEASSPDHPAHERMRTRYERLRALTTEVVEDAIFHGVVSPDRDPAQETVRHMAGWDGLQLLAQYLPDRIDVVEMLEERESLWAAPYGWRDPEDPAPAQDPAGPLPPLIINALQESTPSDAAGYAAGRRRRTRIVTDATQLFARSGYGDTSLREIADAVGVSKSTLLHHYPSKELLLGAVLAERDEALRRQGGESRATRASEQLREIAAGARRNSEQEPGLIEVYAVLSCEAVPPAHPAHEYFASRFGHGIDYFTALFRLAQADGDLPVHRDPEHEAIWLVALWDGLQYQWLYDRDAVDIGAHLAAHLDDVLPRH